MRKQVLPKGYSEERIRSIAEYYENQSEADAVAEDEAAWGGSEFTFIQVPVELVEDVRKLIAHKKGKASNPVSSGVAEPKANYGGSKGQS